MYRGQTRAVGLLVGLAAALCGVAVLRAQAPAGKAEVLALYRQAEALKKEGKRAEAIALYERVVARAPDAFGAADLNTAIFSNNLALLYQSLGQYARAEPLLLRSLEIREVCRGKDHPDVALGLTCLAVLYQEMTQYAKAEPLLLRSLEIWEARRGKDHPDVAVGLNNLAELYRKMGRYGTAEPLYRRSLEIREARRGKDHPDVALALNCLAMLYQDMGQYATAEPLYRRSLEIWEGQTPTDYPSVALGLNNLAMLYRHMGQYARAEPLFLRSLKIREDQLGKDHPAVAQSLNGLAELYRSMGQYAKAEPLYQRSLKIAEALGRDYPHLNAVLNNLAGLYRDMAQFAKAEPLYLRSLELAEAQLGKDHPKVAQVLNNLALVYQSLGQYDKAEHSYRRSLEIGSRWDKDHPNVALALHNLAVLYRERGQYARAEPLLRRSREIREERLGKDHPYVASTLNELAVLSEATGQTEEAVRLLERARRASLTHVSRILPGLAEIDQAVFLKTKERDALHRALSLGLAHPHDAQAALASAAWLLNGKALAQQALAQAALRARDSRDPAVAKLAQDLLAVQQELAQRTFAPPRPGQEQQHRQRLDELNAREQELAKELRNASGSAGHAADWVNLDDLRSRLPADAVFIDVARLEVFDFQATRGEQRRSARYVVWVTPARGDVRVLDLGPADAIDAAVRDLRKTLEASHALILKRGEPEAERELRGPLEALSRLVLRPLLEVAGKNRRWLISPDGALWLVPWQVLLLPEGKYAVEDYQIGYLVSGRDLLAGGAGPRVRPSQPLILADPDYDLGLDQAEAERRRLLPDLDPSTTDTRGVSQLLTRREVRRLPNTAAEARAIVPSLQAYAGVEPRLYTERQALEAVFKAARSPRVVVLSTHGFFLPDQEEERDDADKIRARDASRPAPGCENPLLRCGLLLAGCNSSAEASNRGDDGVLTGLEVVGTDLRGTELVVLSACETGLGEVRNGEGVAGLRQAFQLAGAKAVVATLWQVPDGPSAELMASFFDNLKKGQSGAEALRNAQRQLIEARREENAAAHPLYWAAFTLTGQLDLPGDRRSGQGR